MFIFIKSVNLCFENGNECFKSPKWNSVLSHLQINLETLGSANMRKFLSLEGCQMEIVLSQVAHREILWNLFKSYWNQILSTIYRLILNQTDVRLVPNPSEKGKYSLISGWFNKILKRFICVRVFENLPSAYFFPCCLGFYEYTSRSTLRSYSCYFCSNHWRETIRNQSSTHPVKLVAVNDCCKQLHV